MSLWKSLQTFFQERENYKQEIIQGSELGWGNSKCKDLSSSEWLEAPIDLEKQLLQPVEVDNLKEAKRAALALNPSVEQGLKLIEIARVEAIFDTQQARVTLQSVMQMIKTWKSLESYITVFMPVLKRTLRV